MILAALSYIALLIAPDGHVARVPDLKTPEDCVAVVSAYRSEVPGGRGTCVKVTR